MRPGTAVPLSMIYASAFAGLGVAMPFMPVWLGAQGFSPPEIGIILAVPILVRIVVTAPLMSLVDRGLGPRRLLVFANTVLALAYGFLIVATGAGAVAAAVAIAFAAAAQAPIVPATDLVTLEALRQNPSLDYGRIRLWGSVAFLLATLGAGYGVAAADPAFVVWILGLLAGAGAIVVGVAVPSRAADSASRDRAAEPAARPSLPRPLLLMIASAALAQASHAAVYSFGSLAWQGDGFSASAIGWLWAIGVLAEVVLFAALGRAVRPGRTGAILLMVGSGAAIVRFAGLAADPGFLATAFLQALHGLTFGATHLGTMAALASFAPSGARGRAQGVLALAVALASAAATVLSGFAYRLGAPAAFLSMVPLAAAGFLLASFVARTRPSQPHNAGEGGWSRLPS